MSYSTIIHMSYMLDSCNIKNEEGDNSKKIYKNNIDGNYKTFC